MPNAPRTDGRRPLAGRLLLALVLAVSMALVAACEQVPESSPREQGTAHGPGKGPEQGTEKERQPPQQSAKTLFGGNVWQAPGETRSEALARVDATYGPIAIARVFSSWMPPAWPSLHHDLGRRPLIVSFQLHPSKVLAGEFDHELTSWFRAAPTDRDTYWVYFHEPEDEIERGVFSAEQFDAAWRHIARLAERVDNPRLRATLVLMCWTAGEKSGRDWHDYVPDDGSVDVLAWDCYAKGDDAESYADTEALLEPAHEASASIGAAWGIGELGARIVTGDDGHARAAWLTEVGQYAAANGALFVAYFDAPIGGAFRLTDHPSIHAWARLIDR